MTRRRRALVGALAGALVLAALGAYAWWTPRATVVIGTRFADTSTAPPTLRPGQPFRALLSAGRPYGGSARFVDLELHHDDGGGNRLVRLIPVRVRADDDEALFAVADVVHLVGALRGDFRVVFVRDGRTLTTGRFTVPAP